MEEQIAWDFSFQLYSHYYFFILGTQNIKITRDSGTDPKTDNRKTLERGNIIAAVQDTDIVTKAAGY